MNLRLIDKTVVCLELSRSEKSGALMISSRLLGSLTTARCGDESKDSKIVHAARVRRWPRYGDCTGFSNVMFVGRYGHPESAQTVARETIWEYVLSDHIVDNLLTKVVIFIQR
jgi:hypothetical protein